MIKSYCHSVHLFSEFPIFVASKSGVYEKDNFYPPQFFLYGS